MLHDRFAPELDPDDDLDLEPMTLDEEMADIQQRAATARQEAQEAREHHEATRVLMEQARAHVKAPPSLIRRRYGFAPQSRAEITPPSYALIVAVGFVVGLLLLALCRQPVMMVAGF